MTTHVELNAHAIFCTTAAKTYRILMRMYHKVILDMRTKQYKNYCYINLGKLDKFLTISGIESQKLNKWELT